MTTSVIVTRVGGNKNVTVIFESFYPDKAPVESGDKTVVAHWEDVGRQILKENGEQSLKIYVYDTRRIRIEETDVVLDAPAELKVD